MVTPPRHLPRRQGWKLHLSAPLASAPRVLERAGRVLVAHGCAFKCAVAPRVTAELTATRAARAQSGTFLTAYPDNDVQLGLIAEQLYQATLGLPGPAVLSDRRYRPDSVVHYRYGCFARPRVLNDEGFYEGRPTAPDGTSTPDERNPWFSPPAWAKAPFSASASPPAAPRRRGGPVLLAGRYPVKEAVRHSNRGGVHRAEDTRTGEAVLLKEARSHVGADPAGRDARDRLRYEAEVLAELAPRGITPRVRELFEAGGHLFLAEDLIAGRNLQQWTAEHLERGDGQVPVAVARRLARELVRLVEQVYAAGFVLRDLKPGNVVMTPGERPVLVDLELAVRLGATTRPAGTRGFTDPAYLDAPAVAEDTDGPGAGPAPALRRTASASARPCCTPPVVSAPCSPPTAHQHGLPASGSPLWSPLPGTCPRCVPSHRWSPGSRRRPRAAGRCRGQRPSSTRHPARPPVRHRPGRSNRRSPRPPTACSRTVWPTSPPPWTPPPSTSGRPRAPSRTATPATCSSARPGYSPCSPGPSAAATRAPGPRCARPPAGWTTGSPSPAGSCPACTSAAPAPPGPCTTRRPPWRTPGSPTGPSPAPCASRSPRAAPTCATAWPVPGSHISTCGD
ncbi:hypothetical protein GCM10010339_90320 [Streptomyces alanosinicus]|uniref:Protein kinase domain-containing protein n=1 Tax=Streptomyces alanosinicus TaxID=68171 RepID=A0A918YTD1_9ACTN|nr:hypothetical protein GCM10010339_90320 [Streptomyces alanosinicus]